VCTIVAGSVSFIGEGTCTIDADQPGDTAHKPAPQVQQAFAVSRKGQTIAFNSSAPTAATVNGPAYSVSTSSSSGLPVALSVDAASAATCSISGSSVSFIAAGICTIDANQVGNGEYGPAPLAQQSFGIVTAPLQANLPGGPMLTLPEPSSKFTAGASSFDAATGKVTFVESITNSGRFSWLLTFQNGKFGVFASSSKCRSGFVRLAGKCRPSKVVFACSSSCGRAHLR